MTNETSVYANDGTSLRVTNEQLEKIGERKIYINNRGAITIYDNRRKRTMLLTSFLFDIPLYTTLVSFFKDGNKHNLLPSNVEFILRTEAHKRRKEVQQWLI